MELTINLPDTLPPEKISQLIQEIENILKKEGMELEIHNNLRKDTDAWDNLNLEEIAVDTGIEDFAQNHDHYLYGIPQKS